MSIRVKLVMYHLKLKSRKMLKKMSFSDSQLDQIDPEPCLETETEDVDALQAHSHFFAPPLLHRFSSPFPDCSGALSGARSDGGSTSSTECLESAAEGYRYENKGSLAHDLSFLATMPELCDVTFLVGEERQPVCAVKAILAARSRCVYVYVYVCVCGREGGGRERERRGRERAWVGGGVHPASHCFLMHPSFETGEIPSKLVTLFSSHGNVQSIIRVTLCDRITSGLVLGPLKCACDQCANH